MKKLTAGIFTVLMGLVSVNAADAAVASQGYVDFKVGENTTAISELSGTVQANKAAADAVADRVTTAEGKITAAEGNITTLQGKVQAMEDGNLTIKDGAITETNLATELANKINAAQTEAQVGSAIDKKIDALKLSETYDAKGAANDALGEAKTYAVGKANAALTASVKYTDDYITSLGLQQIASVPVDCSNDTNYCTLTANANGFAWEVIARVEGETVEGRTAVTPQATAKPAAPAALTE